VNLLIVSIIFYIYFVNLSFVSVLFYINFVNPYRYKRDCLLGSLGDAIMNLAERVVDSVSSSSSGYRNDVTFVPSNTSRTVGQFPGYRPVTVEGVLTDNPIDRQKQREMYQKPLYQSGALPVLFILN